MATEVRRLKYNEVQSVGNEISSSLLSMQDLLHYDPKALAEYKKELNQIQAQFKKGLIDSVEAEEAIKQAREQRIAKIHQDTVDAQLKRLEEEKEFSEADYKKRLELINKKSKQLEEEAKKLQTEKEVAEQALKNLDEGTKEYAAYQQLLNGINSKIEENSNKLKAEQDKLDDKEKAYLKRQEELQKKQEALQKRKEKTKQILDEAAKNPSEKISEEDRKTLADSSKEDLKDWLTPSLQGVGKMIGDAIGNLSKAFDAAFSEAETVLNEYQAKISTRLEGSGREYKDITNILRKNLTLNSVIEQKKVLENVGKLVEQGIAYDLEQRAFLQTVSEEISSTFDAFDSNLLRIIRIQREDSSYARMGLETSLSRLFNEYFLDSSYLNNMYDSVSSALIDATSQLTTAQSAEFEYTVQKWLGALYSMGASESFVTQVASGLNMLGTGNVEGLSGSPMQTLFAMAANRTSTDYASLLTGGLNARNTNELLKSMVEYLAEISGNTKNNRVVAGAYSNLFNMTLSDMRAIQNLSSDVNSLYNETMTYNQMGGVTNQRLTTLGDNYSIGKRVSTLFNNVMFSSAQSLVEDPVSYILYKALNFVGGMGEPTVSVAPWGMGMTFKITDLMKDAMFGMSMLANITGAIGNMMSGVGNELVNWTTQGEMRGGGYNLSTRSSTSQSYTMPSSGSDIEQQSLQSGAQKTKETRKTINGQEEEEEDITIETLYYGLLDNTNKEGAVSAINRNILNISNLVTSSYSAETQAQRVVIAGWNMGNDSAGFELPVKFGPIGAEQMRGNMSNVVSAIAGADGATLAALLMLIAGAINEESGSLNVNLASSTLPLKDFAAGTGTPENTRQLPPGNGATRPTYYGGSAGGGSVGRDLTRFTMAVQ